MSILADQMDLAPVGDDVSSATLGEHVRISAALLSDAGIPSLDVWVWANYESLGQGTEVSIRRKVVASKLCSGLTALDDARRRLAGSGWLTRTPNPGRKRSVRHTPLGAPTKGVRQAWIPRWTLENVTLHPEEYAGTVSPDCWRIYAMIILTKGRNPALANVSARDMGEWIGKSGGTAAQRLTELEREGWISVLAHPGEAPTIHVALTPEQAADYADDYTRNGRQSIRRPEEDPTNLAALTPRVCRDTPPANGGTHPPQTTAVHKGQLFEDSRTETFVGGTTTAYAHARTHARARTRTHTRAQPSRPAPISTSSYPLTEAMRDRVNTYLSHLNLTPFDIERQHTDWIIQHAGEHLPAAAAERLWWGWMSRAYRRCTDPSMLAVTDSDRAYAAKCWPDIDVDEENAAFIQKAQEEDLRFSTKGWNRAWEDHMQRAQERCEGWAA